MKLYVTLLNDGTLNIRRQKLHTDPTCRACRRYPHRLATAAEEGSMLLCKHPECREIWRGSAMAARLGQL